MTAALQRIVKAIKELGADERRELKTLIETITAETPRPEEEFTQTLAASGLVTLPTTGLAPFTPVPMSGTPPSEIIIQERR